MNALRTALKRLLSRLLPRGAYETVVVAYWRLRNAIPHAYEPERECLNRFVTAGACVVDVGVNMGQYTSRLRRLVGPSGTVIGFEASPATYRLTRRIVGGPGVELHPAAVGDQAGSVALVEYADAAGVVNSGISRVAAAGTAPADGTVAVPCVRLDDVLGDAGRPIQFIKCDVEGYEVHVIRGAQQLLARDKPALLVEVESAANYGDLVALLTPLGYTAYQLSPQRQWQPAVGFEVAGTSNFLFLPSGQSRARE